MMYQQGCFAGDTVLYLAKDLTENKSARVLVVCSEITTVTFRGSSETHLDSLVGQKLFGDGTAAVIVGALWSGRSRNNFEEHREERLGGLCADRDQQLELAVLDRSPGLRLRPPPCCAKLPPLLHVKPLRLPHEDHHQNLPHHATSQINTPSDLQAHSHLNLTLLVPLYLRILHLPRRTTLSSHLLPRRSHHLEATLPQTLRFRKASGMPSKSSSHAWHVFAATSSKYSRTYHHPCMVEVCMNDPRPCPRREVFSRRGKERGRHRREITLQYHEIMLKILEMSFVLNFLSFSCEKTSRASPENLDKVEDYFPQLDHEIQFIGNMLESMIEEISILLCIVVTIITLMIRFEQLVIRIRC
ncbi:hypothetical protein Fmac_002719 [Flemingia macrophylla]|uniref:Chalcone/stilbene synthase N-terminal domain-containing protein n=1 Tax=Flemingia macrophylla TaxID=520843 RepID=A0ABD1NKP7_9FABA